MSQETLSTVVILLLIIQIFTLVGLSLLTCMSKLMSKEIKYLLRRDAEGEE